jgi:hypothetical protein
MAPTKAPVPGKASRPSPTPAQRRIVHQVADDLEDDGFEEDDEPAPVAPEPPPVQRLFFNGTPVSRIHVDFARDQACFIPNGCVIERMWDLYQVESQGKSCRPRLLAHAMVNVTDQDGQLKVTVGFPDSPGVTRVYTTNTCIEVEP